MCRVDVRLKQPLIFPFALLVFALGIVWAAYVSVSGFIGLVRGQQSWLSLPGLIIFMLLDCPGGVDDA